MSQSKYSHPKSKTQIIKDQMKRFPETPALTLAKKIYKMPGNNKLWLSHDNIRQTINYYRGHHGKTHRKLIKGSDLETPLTYDTNPFKLPESSANIRKDYILPKAATNILMLSDIHFPYQNNEALTLALQYGKDHDINTIYLNGDILDMYQCSFHEKDMRKRSLSDELDSMRTFIVSLRANFPKAKIYYKEGNHEARLSRYLMVKAPELLDCQEFELPILLKLGENGIEWIPNKQAVKIGKLYVLHGNEFKGGGGVNPARAYYLKSKVSMIAGDKHQTSEHTEQSLNGDIVTCWSTGCLCELNPDYMPYNKWNLGAGHIQMHPSGDFEVRNFRIIPDKSGKLKIV